MYCTSFFGRHWSRRRRLYTEGVREISDGETAGQQFPAQSRPERALDLTRESGPASFQDATLLDNALSGGFTAG